MTMKTEQKVIGVYTFCSTGSVLVHELDGDKVLASINGKHLEWCDITERYSEDKKRLGVRLQARLLFCTP